MIHALTSSNLLQGNKNTTDQVTKQLLAYYYDRISIFNNDSYLLLRLEEILFIKAISNYSTIFLANGQKILTSKTLKTWEAEINHTYFYRCHRTYLVNSKHIKSINLKTNTLQINEVLIPIARLRKPKNFKI